MIYNVKDIIFVIAVIVIVLVLIQKMNLQLHSSQGY